MDDFHFRERLDRLLGMVERSKSDSLIINTARLIDLLPVKNPAMLPVLLVKDKPYIKMCLGKHDPLSRNKMLVELQRHRSREDTFGQVADMMASIIESQDSFE